MPETTGTKYEFDDLLALNPSIDGVYLNWGAGVSTTSEKVKKLGYKLFNYDPFVNGLSNYISIDQINEMKFDGIISHNVLEHFRDPISELKLMKSLLKPNGSMIHSTGCYKYLFEYTKYHLFFFKNKFKEPPSINSITIDGISLFNKK